MAPRLKILMSLCPRKEPRYTILFSQKVPASESTPGSPTGPYGERYTLTGHFYVSLDISLYVKSPKERASLHVPPKVGPIWK
jgi:hypothetical protein